MAKRTKDVKDSSETMATKRTPARRKAAVPRARKPKAAAAGPTHEEIAQRAYEIFLHRGSRMGHEVDDWLEAERQLRGSGSR